MTPAMSLENLLENDEKLANLHLCELFSLPQFFVFLVIFRIFYIFSKKNQYFSCYAWKTESYVISPLARSHYNISRNLSY